jgi:hypothetical protein
MAEGAALFRPTVIPADGFLNSSQGLEQMNVAKSAGMRIVRYPHNSFDQHTLLANLH